MATGLVEKWHGMDLAEFGPIFPMVETTEMWFVVCVLFWLGWHVWQGINERKTYDHDEDVLKNPEVLRWALHQDTIAGAYDNNKKKEGDGPQQGEA